MGFWDVVKHKADRYSRTVAQKTNKLVEKTKRSITLTEYEDDLKDLYAFIGEQVYAASHNNTQMPDFETVFTQVAECTEKIEKLKLEIDDLSD